MSAHALIRHRRLLHHDGRRYVVRGPTYATFHAVVSEYAQDVVAVASVYRDHKEGLTVGGVLDSLSLFDDRAVRVLTTCVETDADPKTWPLRQLAEAILGLCDLSAIAEHVGVEQLAGMAEPKGDEEAPVAEDDGLPGDVMVVQLAREFGCSPMDVMDWPFEAVMATADCLVAIKDADAQRGESPKHSAEFLRLVRQQTAEYEA